MFRLWGYLGIQILFFCIVLEEFDFLKILCTGQGTLRLKKKFSVLETLTLKIKFFVLGTLIFTRKSPILGTLSLMGKFPVLGALTLR